MNQIACIKNACSPGSAFDPRSVLVDDNVNTLSIAELGPILVASPHPDDESLGCGGLIARCAGVSIPITVLAMTSGDASHPGDRAWRTKLATIRQREQRNALKALGLKQPDIVSLGLPDGGLDTIKGQMREQIVDLIQDVVQSRTIKSIFIPAIDDCHNDHQETARFMAEVVRRCPVKYVFSYQVWPPDIRAPQVRTNETPYRHDISDLLALKRQAIHEHQSQLGMVDPAHTEGFQMPPALLETKLKKQESYALVRDLSAWSA